MIIIDSNVWIAFFNINDTQHKKAVLIFSKIQENILITEYIILEVCTVLAMRVGKKTSDDFLEIVFNNQDVQVVPALNDFFNKSVKYFLNYKNNDLSFVDVSLLNFSKNYKIITFDKNLLRAIKVFNA